MAEESFTWSSNQDRGLKPTLGEQWGHSEALVSRNNGHPSTWVDMSQTLKVKDSMYSIQYNKSSLYTGKNSFVVVEIIIYKTELNFSCP